MKKNLLPFLSLVLAVSLNVNAQTNPGTANLTHQWTFDDGTANDAVGSAHGVLKNGATVVNNALVTAADGQHLSIPPIGINAYTSATMEIWYQQDTLVNTGWTIFAYIGTTSGTLGANYWFMTTARGDDNSRTAISCLNTTDPWVTESGVNKNREYHDGLIHQMVSTLDADSIKFYIDGQRIGAAILSANNHLMNLSNDSVFLGKGGYMNDPSWRGQIHKFSVYNKALSEAEVLYLFQGGSTKVSIAKTNNIRVFPTLVSDYITLQGINGSAKLEISDIRGKIVAKATNVHSNQKIHISLKPGTYFVKTTNGNKVSVSKIVSR